jgi:PAS domain S-box-containing protein
MGDMTEKKPDGSTKVAALRRQAEERLRTTRRDIAAMASRDVQQLVYELQVHQIELEMQNDELRRVQEELESARDRYLDLYDFSPAGHLTLDNHGRIVEANLRAGTLLRVNRKELIGQLLAHFVDPKDGDAFHRHCQEILKAGTRQTCEVRLREEIGVPRWVHLESVAVHHEPRRITLWRTSLMDISDRRRAEQELETQRAELRAIIGSAMDAIITVDEKECVMLFNRAAESMFLCQAADAIGQPLARFIPERITQSHLAHIGLFAKTVVPPRSMLRQRAPLVGLRSNGEEFPFEASFSHVRVEGQNLSTIILRDVTERRIAENILQASDAFTRAVLDSLVSHVCVLDKDGVITKTNEAWTEFLRHYPNSAFTLGVVGQNYLDLCRRNISGGKSTNEAILKGIETVLQGRDPVFSAEYCASLPEEECWFQLRVTPLKGAKGVVISHTDISARVRIARALEEHVLLLGKKREELESLTGKLLEAQEQERQRIARDLHDDFNQRLAALSVELESLERPDTLFPEPVTKRLEVIRGQVGRLSDDLHDLAYRLHPSLLEHVGLEVAVRDHIAEFTKRTGLPVTFTAHKVSEQLSPDVATNLFRVMQESLQNAFKHAQATDVTVRLIGSSKGIGLSVRDNGKGIDFENKNSRMKGLGLVSMQERTRLLGGFLQIQSPLGKGLKVCAWVPHLRDGA